MRDHDSDYQLRKEQENDATDAKMRADLIELIDRCESLGAEYGAVDQTYPEAADTLLLAAYELRKLDALASQEPVAWRYEWSPFEFEQWSWNVSLKDPRIAPVRRYRNVQPLFASPVEPVAAKAEEGQS